jgi:hypothetical protein
MTTEQIKKEIGMRIAKLEFTASKIDLNVYRDPSQLLAALQTKASYAAQAEELRSLLKTIDGAKQ